MIDEDNTSYSLIGRALDLGDNDAWNLLLARYEKFIYYVLNDMNLFQSEIDDVAQNVLINLMSGLKSFDPNKGLFRTWLRRIIANSCISHIRKINSSSKNFSTFLDDWEVVGVKEESRFEAYIEDEWKTFVVNEAMRRVAKSFRGQAIDVFKLCLSGKSTEEIQELTGLTQWSVYRLKLRVKKGLVYEIERYLKNVEIN